MLRRQNQEIPDQANRNWSTCSSLLSRIRDQRLQGVWNTYIGSFQKRSFELFIYILVLLIFQCPNRVYNAWQGPFPMNLNQFRNHLEINYNLIDYRSFFPFHRFFIRTEYIQIELGQNIIDQSTKNTFRMLYGRHPNGKLLYTFYRVREPTIDTSGRAFYIKFASEDQAYSQRRYPYDFQSFSINTLQCIVEQLTIPSIAPMHSPEKSIYIDKIKKIYNQNPIVFNKKVITKCGILIGYLYRPTDEYVFPADSYQYYRFTKHARAFDASYSYTPYMSYVLIGVFICLLFKIIVHLIQDTIYLICSFLPRVHPSVQKEMIESNINSLKNLDNFLLSTIDDNNYYDRLFIVRDKYLIMLMIDLQENNEKILQQFSEDAPLTIIPIDIINRVERDCIVLGKNDCSRRIYFPIHSHINPFDPSDWLHQRLMDFDEKQDFELLFVFLSWEEEEQLRHNEEEYRHRIAVLTEEEMQNQRRQYENNISRIWQRTTSASPRFIAEFRLANRQIVTSNLVDKTCSICLKDLELNQYYTQWPCTAKHTFHFDCMLDVLRARNTCPSCRSPIEAADSPNTKTVLRLISRRMMPNIFT